MIYLTIPIGSKDGANKWCRENVDPHGDTFTENQEDKSTRDRYCLISIPDDGSEYAEKLKKQFGGVNISPKVSAIKLGAKEKFMLQDIS